MQGHDQINIFKRLLFAEGQNILTERLIRILLEWSRLDMVAWIRGVATIMRINGLFQENSGGRITGYSNLFHGECWGRSVWSDSQVQGSSNQVNAGAIC